MSPTSPSSHGAGDDNRDESARMRDGGGAAENSQAHPDFSSSGLSSDRLELLRLEAAVEQFCLNLGESDGWDGTTSYNSPEIWTMRGYLEPLEVSDSAELAERFGKAWAIVGQVVESKVDDSYAARSAEVLLKSHLLNQVAVTLVTNAIRAEVEHTKEYIVDSLMQPFCHGTAERSEKIAALGSDAASSRDEAEKEAASLLILQSKEAEATVQTMVRTLVSLRNALPLLVDGGVTEHKVSYITELAIEEGFYENLQSSLEQLLAEPFEVVIRQTCGEMIGRMERVLREGGFLDGDESFCPNLGSLESQWKEVAPSELLI